MASVHGFVGKIIHKGENFFVFSFDLADSDPKVSEKNVTMSGHLYGLAQVAPGIAVQFVGDWIKHPKYGRQFSPYGWHPWATNDYQVKRFLTECIPGFTDSLLVDEIVDTFGTLTFEKLTDSPDEILDIVPEEGPRRMQLQAALASWKDSRALSSLSVFLQDYDLSEDTIRNVLTRFGVEAVEVIADNPYRLVAVDGFTFAKADRLAKRMGIGLNDPKRMDGAVLWILKSEAQQGHLSVRRGDFSARLKGLSELEQVSGFEGEAVQQQLMSAVDRLEKVSAGVVDSTVGVYLPDLYRYERGSAEKIASFLTPSKIDIDVSAFLAEYERSNQINLSPAQMEAVHKLIANRVLVLTGLPGTGKTTLIRTMVRLFKETGISALLMAPTGIAAKRLAGVTGESASTIHRTFGYNGSTWEFNGVNKFGVGAVIVDELSMVDMELFYRILDALHPSTLLVFAGDDAQLPSVGPGNVLRELISCSAVPHVRLTHIFRQSQQSEIVVASHKINRGESPQLDRGRQDSEFQFVPLLDEDRILELIVKMAAKLKARDANFQVLAPKYDGSVGVHSLNHALRDELNPYNGQREWKAGSLHFREGDRVMVVKNDYKLNVSNGDMGKIIEINRESIDLKVHGVAGSSDTHVSIPKHQAVSMLRLAYAITVHKSQGSEFETVILPIVRSQGRMLQRNLFYTAVTRAKKRVWLIGDHSAVYKAIGNDRVIQRNTAFARAISESVSRLSGVGAANGKEAVPSGQPDGGSEGSAVKPVG